MNILLYLIILIMGAILGSKMKWKSGRDKAVGLVQNLALYFLLFVMGIKIGLDEEILGSFGTIGLQGMVLAAASVLFSIAGVRLVSKTLFTDAEKEQVNHDL